MEKLTLPEISRKLIGLVMLLTTFFLLTTPATAAGCHNLSSSTLERKANNYSKTIRSASHRYGVHEDLIKAVITVESCFQRKARGLDGEKGLMQLMPGTARRFNVKRGYNSWENVHAGAKYLSYLINRYGGDTERAIAAYNAGEGRIKRHGRIFNRDYVRKVMTAYGKFSGKPRRALRKSRSSSAARKTSKRRSKARKKSARARSARSTRRAVSRRSKSTQNRSARSHKTKARRAVVHRRQTKTRALPWRDKARTHRSRPVRQAAPRATRSAHSNRRQGAYFRVRAGHTVYEVMRQTGVPVNKIIRLNGLKAPYHLQTGQRLRLR